VKAEAFDGERVLGTSKAMALGYGHPVTTTWTPGRPCGVPTE
jgi:hypothetical protein